MTDFRWYVGRTEPRREHHAAGSLVAHRIQVYFPEIPSRKLAGRKMRLCLEPLMPGYLFLRLLTGQEPWVRIRNTPGMISSCPVLTAAGRFASIPAKAVEIIRGVEERLNAPITTKPWEIGQKVQISTGPLDDYYAELPGIIESLANLDRKGRITVTAWMLGRLTSLDVPVTQVCAA